MNIIDLFDQRAERTPHVPAVIDGSCGAERSMDFAEFAMRSRRLATLFRASGLAVGDGVVIMVPMSAQLYVVVAAVLRAGLVAVFLDPAASNAHFLASASRYPLRAFVGTRQACLLRLVRSGLRAIPRVFAADGWFPGAQSLDRANACAPMAGAAACADETPALIAFTSGTTGPPKGVVRSHGLLRATQSALAQALALGAGETSLATMPVFTLINLGTGVTSLIPDVDLRRPARVDGQRLAVQLQRWQVQSMVAAPGLLERLAAACGDDDPRLASLSSVHVGGAPVLPPLIAECRRVAPRAALRIVYGCTEAEPIAGIAAADFDEGDLAVTRSGGGLLVGHPVAQLTLRVLRDRWGTQRAPRSAEDFAADCVEAGCGGEIVVAGAHVIPGYLGGVGDEASKFKIGSTLWHRTGDAGRLDAQGRLWILGRCATRLGQDADSIYPGAVEAALSLVPAVRRAAMLDYDGHRLLVVQPRGGARIAARELVDAVAWARPSALLRVRAVPVDGRHNAKIDYPALRRMLDRMGHRRYETVAAVLGQAAAV